MSIGQKSNLTNNLSIGLGWSYCCSQLDELEKEIFKRESCAWSKFSPHITKLFYEIDRNTAFIHLMAKAHHVKNMLMLHSWSSLHEKVRQLECNYFSITQDWNIEKFVSLDNCANALVAEVSSFSAECPRYGTKLFHAAFFLQCIVRDCLLHYRIQRPIPKMIKIDVHVFTSKRSLSLHVAYVHSQIKDLKLEIGRDNKCLPGLFLRKFDQLSESIQELQEMHERASNSCQFLRRQLSRVRIYYLQRSIYILSNLIQLVLQDPSKCAKKQFNKLNNRVIKLKIEQEIYNNFLNEKLKNMRAPLKNELAPIDLCFVKNALERFEANMHQRCERVRLQLLDLTANIDALKGK